MTRRGLSDAQREASARQAARRVIARGERPLFRVRKVQDGTWAVDWCPWLTLPAAYRRESLSVARAAVAWWLGVDGSAVEVVAVDYQTQVRHQTDDGASVPCPGSYRRTRTVAWTACLCARPDAPRAHARGPGDAPREHRRGVARRA
jgi:hypothetical protein